MLDKLKAAARERGPVEPVPARTCRPTRPAPSCRTSTTPPISEQLGKVGFASEALNCAAPDTGNMEILNLYGSETVKRDWLAPLLEGEIRSAFSMTEPDVASSDATNIGLRIERDGDEYVLNGTKWFSSGALRRPLQGAHRHGQDRPERAPAPAAVDDRRAEGHAGRHASAARRTCSATTTRGGHPEIVYEDVRVPADNLLGEEGGGFAIVAGPPRPGPHPPLHALDRRGRAGARADGRPRRSSARTFGTLVAQKGLIQDWIAESRIEIDMAASTCCTPPT